MLKAYSEEKRFVSVSRQHSADDCVSPGRATRQSSIVAAIQVAVLGKWGSHWVNVDLGIPKAGETKVARNALCLAAHPVSPCLVL